LAALAALDRLGSDVFLMDADLALAPRHGTRERTALGALIGAWSADRGDDLDLRWWKARTPAQHQHGHLLNVRHVRQPKAARHTWPA